MAPTPRSAEERRAEQAARAARRARRAYVGEAIEALVNAERELGGALLAADAVQAHTALKIADGLEDIAAKLRAGAEASGVTPEPRPTTVKLGGDAARF